RLLPQNPLAANAAHRASVIGFLRWQLARRSRKSPLHARALAQTMSALPFPGISELDASKSAMGSSMPRARHKRNTGPRLIRHKEAGGLKHLASLRRAFRISIDDLDFGVDQRHCRLRR